MNQRGMWDPNPWYDIRYPEFSVPFYEYAVEVAAGDFIVTQEAAQQWFMIGDDDMDSFWGYYTQWSEGTMGHNQAAWAFNE